MPNPIDMLGEFLMPTDEEKTKISKSKRGEPPVEKEVEKLKATPEIKERHPEEVEREKMEEREALHREAREMLLEPEHKEALKKEKEQDKSPDETARDLRMIDLAEKHGYLLSIRALLNRDPFEPYDLDRLHSILNNPDYAQLKKKI